VEETVNFDDFVPNRPFFDAAKRRLEEYLSERPNPHGKLSDDSIANLMADYASESWQEGYDDGYGDGETDGYGRGLADGEDTEDNELWNCSRYSGARTATLAVPG
jgi:hypothetical protein